MNGNKRKLTRNIILFVVLFISFSGCTDLSLLGKKAEVEFNEASVADDSKALTDAAITFASGDSAASVTTDFSLPLSGDDGSTITWSSSNTDVITINEDGSTTVTRPSGSNVVVELTATITKGTVTVTKIISVTVLAVEGVNSTITFESLVAADGTDGSVDTTMLTLTFSVDPTTLTADDITVTGATKGELTGTGTTRSLAISDITVANGENVSVAITSPTGFTISGSPQTAVVYKNTALTSVTFESAVQTGGTSGTADSTSLTLTFSTDPTTLAAGDITVTGATKGALSGSGTTRTLAISNITVANGETVSVEIASPSGFTISGSPQTAVVYRALAAIITISNPSDPVFSMSLSSFILQTGGGNTEETVTVNPGTGVTISNYQWFVNGSSRGAGGTISLNTSDNPDWFELGANTLTLVVTIDNAPYSDQFFFRVEEF